MCQLGCECSTQGVESGGGGRWIEGGRERERERENEHNPTCIRNLMETYHVYVCLIKATDQKEYVLTETK